MRMLMIYFNWSHWANEAIDNFDITWNVKFSIYAVPMIIEK